MDYKQTQERDKKPVNLEIIEISMCYTEIDQFKSTNALVFINMSHPLNFLTPQNLVPWSLKYET